ncbi:hypothetical protein P7K49_002823 [Saguinus oedipus]|uniref:Uncharacterized protein n=1 Tax=Saguinus oedipus TaxID=9490 RepID=A0ABQ9WIF6_SAGOE|nr:hypothetical protein P7K49_002823 [Saguinus oedipus]
MARHLRILLGVPEENKAVRTALPLTRGSMARIWLRPIQRTILGTVVLMPFPDYSHLKLRPSCATPEGIGLREQDPGASQPPHTQCLIAV